MALLSFDGDNAYKKYAETSVSKKFKLIPIESIKIEGGEVSQDDIYLLESLGLRGSFTIDICGDIYSGLKLGIDDGDGTILTFGDVEKYGVCIRLTPNIESGRTIYSCELDPKKYGKDLSTSYYLRFYAEVSDLDVTNDYRFLVDKKRAIEFGEDANLIAAKPYIEETYDTHGNLIGVKLHGYTKIRDNIYSGITTLKTIEMPDNISYIGSYAFADCTNLALTSLPAGLTSIGNNTFHKCVSLALTSLPEGLTSIGWSAFQNCTNLALTSLPEGLTSIDSNAFSGCSNLALTSLPEGLTSIGNSAFEGCTNLAHMSLPESLTRINGNAFYKCTGLTSIIFRGTPSNINPVAFNSCTNLTDIKVPWAEGAVSGAPWGATNATITYNYTGA